MRIFLSQTDFERSESKTRISGEHKGDIWAGGGRLRKAVHLQCRTKDCIRWTDHLAENELCIYPWRQYQHNSLVSLLSLKLATVGHLWFSDLQNWMDWKESVTSLTMYLTTYIFLQWPGMSVHISVPCLFFWVKSKNFFSLFLFHTRCLNEKCYLSFSLMLTWALCLYQIQVPWNLYLPICISPIHLGI